MTASRRVICNAGPLIALAKLNRLELLFELYKQVEIPSGVYREVVVEGLARGAADARIVQIFWERHKWPIVDVPEKLIANLQPRAILDRGETEVLAIASQDPSVLVLIDDDLARQEARRLKVEVKGTLGVLVRAVRQQVLTFEEAEFLIQQIAARADIWISVRLCEGVLEGLKQ